ncbi:fasciclin-like arabinogalactan protein 19 [Cajanus cajan]|uniref:Fasciclin-like arabinogalactan protein 19 n=1 Tax=Cajanus cajan TaxID=3821 RepID=A0A151R889_CAJCA|nr:fasciclin-like arabinogalactan protein 19 [Cajanus cajan]KYP38830.1 Fasciclin-like arabinogalactan protein 19 [Cajanus cajan]
MLDIVPARGYDLFYNTIITLDLQIQLVDNNNSHSFMFFAPTDASLFVLDMTQIASSYTDTLRLHDVPRRLSLMHRLLLTTTRSPRSPPSTPPPTHAPLSLRHRCQRRQCRFPNLFFSRNIIFHDLIGVLSLRSNNSPSLSSIPC